MSKALSEYESAMNVFDQLMIFKHLYNSIELFTNVVGGDRPKAVLTAEVARITGTAVPDVEQWLRFYNRAKHVDKDVKQVTDYVEGVSSLSKTLSPLRHASACMILHRLAEIQMTTK
jgi:hypothetical protein